MGETGNSLHTIFHEPVHKTHQKIDNLCWEQSENMNSYDLRGRLFQFHQRSYTFHTEKKSIPNLGSRNITSTFAEDM